MIGAHSQGFNTGLRRDLGDRELRAAVSHGGRAVGPRAAPRVEDGRRARRPAVERARRLRREPEVPQGRAALPARDLRPPRHGLHDLSRAALRRPSWNRRVGGRPRPAEALHGRSRGPVGSVRQLLRQALDGASLDGDDHRHDRAAGCRIGALASGRTSSGRGMRASPRCPATAGRIAPGPGVRPASGTLGAAGRPAVIQDVSADPAGFTPNGDGKTDTTAIAYELGGAATVRIDLQTEQGSPLATLQTASKAAGRHVFAWNGGGYPDGRYRIVVAARSGGREVTAATNVVLSRTLSGFGILPAAISPNGDGRADSLAASFNLALASLQICPSGAAPPWSSVLRLAPADSGSTRSVAGSATALLGDVDRHGSITWPGGVATVTARYVAVTDRPVRSRSSCRCASTESPPG